MLLQLFEINDQGYFQSGRHHNYELSFNQIHTMATEYLPKCKMTFTEVSVDPDITLLQHYQFCQTIDELN